MARSAEDYKRLQSIYHFPEEFLNLKIECIFSVMKVTDPQRESVRLTNLFAKSSCSTIGDIMELNIIAVTNIRGFGAGAADFLLELLDRIKEDPKKFHAQHYRVRNTGNVLMRVEPQSRKCTLHRPDCGKIPMGADIIPYTESDEAIGWLDFDTVEDTVSLHKAHLERFEYRLCRVCFANEAKQLFKARGTNQSPQYPIL